MVYSNPAWRENGRNEGSQRGRGGSNWRGRDLLSNNNHNSRNSSSTPPIHSSASSGSNSSAGLYNPRGYTTHVPHQRSRQQHAPFVDEAYKSWREVRIRVKNLPPQYTDTWELWKFFSRHGQMSFIRIEVHTNGKNDRVGGQALLVFSTTPTTPFWARQDLMLPLGGGLQPRPLAFDRPSSPKIDLITSPIDGRKTFPRVLTIPAAWLIFGLMRNPEELIAMRQIVETQEHPILLELNLEAGRQKFDIRFSASPSDHKVDSLRYRLQASLQLLHNVIRYNGKDRACLIISVHDPPRYFKQADNLEKTHTRRREIWQEWPKMWERQTDIDKDMKARNTEAISLVRSDPIIDTGRWLTFRLDFPNDSTTKARLDTFCTALNHHNIHVRHVDNISLIDRTETEAWDYLNPHKAAHASDLHQMQDDLVHLDFDVQYQLEVCISQHRLNEYNMKLDFFQKLSSIDKTFALSLLKNVADSKKMYHDPMTIFDAMELRVPRKRTTHQGCVLMHSVTITPTTLRINTPTVEVSNRVIRDNSQYGDRFIRIRFEDEDYTGRLYATSFHDNQEEVYHRIERALRNGVHIGGRHYDFLAHGNSQFREHGGYFYASTSDKTADQIRTSLGQFDKINIVAKYAARIGQCFSTTRAIRQLPRRLKCLSLNDIYGESDVAMLNYCFTDGVGKLSPFVARMIAEEFRINCTTGDYPSVYQFRMGGHKGILAVDPSLKGMTVGLRPSQRKFETTTEGLEIIRVSSFAQAYLNQQIVLVLSSLGVADKVFVDKMVVELRNIDKAMTDNQTALDLLQANVDFNRVSLSMAEMILDGFMGTKEPFLMSLLQLWRAWRIKLLKEKAHISVKDGAFVLGCTDETGSLSMKGSAGIPEIFIQIKNSDTNSYAPVEGLCLLARNPSLHPGDVRVVMAVACNKLSYLKDVVAFPQKGERDLANMCSGGDLDGDDYLVIWDKALFPPRDQWNLPAMDFTSPIPRVSANTVNKEHLIENFVNYIKNDILGRIATQHRAFADFFAAAGGVKHPQCIKLAEQHSIAVDFPKSGVPAKLDEDVSRLPAYPHWMERKYSKSYTSQAVLGQLYDKVIRQDFHPQTNNAFDKRILTRYELTADMLQAAQGLKRDYDADIRRVMAQQGVKTEFEIWTSFVMEHNREKRDYQFAEEMGRIISMLKNTYCDLALKHVGLDQVSGKLSNDEWAKLGPFVAAMYTVTKKEVDAARSIQDTVARPRERGPTHDEDEYADDEGSNGEDAQSSVFEPLISFPWIFSAELGRIAMGDQRRLREHATPSTKVPKNMIHVSSLAPGVSAPDYSLLMPLPEAAMPAAGSGWSSGLLTEMATSRSPPLSASAYGPVSGTASVAPTSDPVSGAATPSSETTKCAPSSSIPWPMTANVGLPAAVAEKRGPQTQDEVDGITAFFNAPTFEELREILEAGRRSGDEGSKDMPLLSSGSSEPLSSMVSSRSSISLTRADANYGDAGDKDGDEGKAGAAIEWFGGGDVHQEDSGDEDGKTEVRAKDGQGDKKQDLISRLEGLLSF